MPCWTVQENGLEIKNPDPETMISALAALGFSVNQTADAIRDGHFEADCFSGDCAYCSVTWKRDGLKLHLSRAAKITMEALTSKVKVAYSGEIVKTAAKRFGWSVKQTSETQFQVIRRY